MCRRVYTTYTLCKCTISRDELCLERGEIEEADSNMQDFGLYSHLPPCRERVEAVWGIENGFCGLNHREKRQTKSQDFSCGIM